MESGAQQLEADPISAIVPCRLMFATKRVTEGVDGVGGVIRRAGVGAMLVPPADDDMNRRGT